MPEYTVTITGKRVKDKDNKPLRRKRWYAVVDFGPDPNKKRKRVWSQAFDTEAEAKAHRDELLRTRPTAKTLANRRVTLAHFVDNEWLPGVVTRYRPSTYASYERNLRQHVLPKIGHIRLCDLDTHRLSVHYGALQTEGRHDGNGGLSRRTVHYIHTIIHRVLRDAVDWHFVASNPADRAMPDPTTSGLGTRHDFRTWSGDEVARFLAESRAHRGRGKRVGDRLYAAWVLLITTGMRRGEVLGLRWSDVHLDGAHLAVRQTVVDVPRQAPTFSEPKTKKSFRNVALDQATVAVLRAHKARQAAERLAAGESWQDHDLVFSTQKGEPLHPDRFSREFARRVEAYGLPRIRLHDLRHTHATLALQQGFNLKIISERLGHSNIGTTANVYAHVAPTLQAEAAEAVASLFMPAAGG